MNDSHVESVGSDSCFLSKKMMIRYSKDKRKEKDKNHSILEEKVPRTQMLVKMK